MNAERCFAHSYAEARRRFVAAAEAAGLDVHARLHPMLGHDGEALALDVARLGPPDAPALLIVSSGCHGVEGYAGSALQLALLADPGFHAAAQADGIAVLYLHALNPYGYSWWRRTTHENVDLNRNFVDFHAPLPRNEGYDRLAHWIVPPTWPPMPDGEAALAAYAAAQGAAALQAAVSAGQYEHPQGLYYGGHDPTWSQVELRHVLQEHGGRCRRLGWIDVHTGLGPCGHGERIYAGRDDAAALARARTWWGPAVTSTHDGSSSSVALHGQMYEVVYDECPHAEYTGIALEFGTLPLAEVFDALRADQWLENHPEIEDRARREANRRRMRDTFYIDRDDWKRQVIAQGLDAAYGALRGLAG